MSRGNRATVFVSHAPLPRAVLVLGSAWAVVSRASPWTLAAGVPQSESSQLLGNLAIFVALGFCAVTSPSPPPARLARGWVGA